MINDTAAKCRLSSFTATQGSWADVEQQDADRKPTVQMTASDEHCRCVCDLLRRVGGWVGMGCGAFFGEMGG